jgi:hypothetical protein
MKIDLFLAQKGATACPGMGTPELAALNASREGAFISVWQRNKQKRKKARV